MGFLFGPGFDSRQLHFALELKELKKQGFLSACIGIPKPVSSCLQNISLLKINGTQKKLEVNHYHNNNQYINAKIKELISKLETYEFKLRSNGQHLSLDLLDDFALKNFENYDNMTFNEFFKKQLETRKFNTASTYQTHKKTYNKFNAFKKNVHFHELTISLIEQFDEYMKEQGLMTNSRSNHHKTLKANLHIAATEGFIEHTKIPYSTQIGGIAGKFKVKKEQGSIVNLDFEERERIEGLQYKGRPHLDRYRKIFLFMCYTGLRISDMENLRPEHLHHTLKGYQIDLKENDKNKKACFSRTAHPF